MFKKKLILQNMMNYDNHNGKMLKHVNLRLIFMF
jgi:hypothetical protein